MSSEISTKPPAAKRKRKRAVAIKAAEDRRPQSPWLRTHGPTLPAPIWAWMRAGTFPRSRAVQGRSMWLSTEIEAWMHALPRRALKGDQVKP